MVCFDTLKASRDGSLDSCPLSGFSVGAFPNSHCSQLTNRRDPVVLTGIRGFESIEHGEHLGDFFFQVH